MVAAKTNGTGYDPERSKVSEDTMSNFVNSNVTGDLNEVPGLGPKGVQKLAGLPDGDAITNTWQLFGHYLILKGPDTKDENGNLVPVDCETHNNKFWSFLQEKGINAHRSAIVKAVALKSAQFFPGIYDPRVYAGEEEEDDE